MPIFEIAPVERPFGMPCEGAMKTSSNFFWQMEQLPVTSMSAVAGGM
jgi:hypothetical protein